MLLAILLRESAVMKSAGPFPLLVLDGGLVSLDKLGLRENPSIGMGQMREAVYNRTAAGYPEVFAGRRWEELMYDDTLAIAATAYHLADLRQSLDAVSNNSPLRADQLLAVGYNGGESYMLKVAKSGAVTGDAAKYLSGRSFVFPPPWTRGMSTPGYDHYYDLASAMYGG
ncbi:MAG TPA: hypothetical protein VFM55_23165 [Micromonosporaceae bacterium]|nr:hypothetical protein [Micromonosporaceae bacterium]